MTKKIRRIHNAKWYYGHENNRRYIQDMKKISDTTMQNIRWLISRSGLTESRYTDARREGREAKKAYAYAYAGSPGNGKAASLPKKKRKCLRKSCKDSIKSADTVYTGIEILRWAFHLYIMQSWWQ